MSQRETLPTIHIVYTDETGKPRTSVLRLNAPLWNMGSEDAAEIIGAIGNIITQYHGDELRARKAGKGVR